MIAATIVGNATANPDVRRTRNGDVMAHFGVACNNSQKDQNGNWNSVGVLFVQVTALGKLAENIAATITKGTEVIVQGYLGARDYQDRNGNNRTSHDMTARACGPSLRWDSYQVNQRQDNGYQQSNQGGFQQSNQGGFGQQQQWTPDPWNSGQPQQPQDENPPF